MACPPSSAQALAASNAEMLRKSPSQPGALLNCPVWQWVGKGQAMLPKFWPQTPMARAPQQPKKLAIKKQLFAGAIALACAPIQAKDSVDTAVAAGNFKSLAAALQATGLAEPLRGKGRFTLLAPSDEAFANVPKGDLDALLKVKAKLAAVLTCPVSAGKVLAQAIKPVKIKSAPGGELTVASAGGFTVDTAKVAAADLLAANGVIPVIGTVLILQ